MSMQCWPSGCGTDLILNQGEWRKSPGKGDDNVLTFISHISHTRRAAHIALHVGGEAQRSSYVLRFTPWQRWQALSVQGEDWERRGRSSRTPWGRMPREGGLPGRQSQLEEEAKPLPRRKSKHLSQAEFNPMPRHTVTEGNLIRKDTAITQRCRGCSRFLPENACVTLPKRSMLSFVFNVKFLASSNVH